MQLSTLKDLYIEQLKDLYNAESQLTDALPKMVKAASSEELRRALEDHLEVTRNQKNRLERIFERLEAKPKGVKCKGMEGLIKEGSEMIEAEGDRDVIDAGLIAAAQRVEHYEISGYGTARTYAERLGEDEARDLLQQTLEEESAADEKLTRIAERVVNPKAEKERAGVGAR